MQNILKPSLRSGPFETPKKYHIMSLSLPPLKFKTIISYNFCYLGILPPKNLHLLASPTHLYHLPTRPSFGPLLELRELVPGDVAIVRTVQQGEDHARGSEVSWRRFFRADSVEAGLGRVWPWLGGCFLKRFTCKVWLGWILLDVFAFLEGFGWQMFMVYFCGVLEFFRV